jgi:hypothetical protein
VSKARGCCIDQRAFCRDCDWTYENQKNGIALAGKHHKATGHEVVVEVLNLVTYDREGD